MYRLILDSSTKLMWIGLVKEDELIDQYIRVAKRDHAKYMVDAIDQLLKKNQITIKKVDQFIVGAGPGSYTGLRVSGMVAKMLAYTTNKPLYKISSIFLLMSGYEGLTAGLIDARRDQYFTELYDGEKTILEDKLLLFQAIQDDIIFKDAKIIILNEDNYIINVKKVINKMVKVDDIHGFVPNYLRETEAERNLWNFGYHH